jgi:hypothetical protein
MPSGINCPSEVTGKAGNALRNEKHHIHQALFVSGSIYKSAKKSQAASITCDLTVIY